ncbi:MAG: hypothetical protein ABI035_13800 [Gemmatimonadaceae bacterium]
MPDKLPDRANSGRPGSDHRSVATLEGAAELHVRPIDSLAEFRACVAIQEEVWGIRFVDVVCASVLQIASHIGGIVLGAFTPTGGLVGFVAGFTGFKDGQPVHWSHMLGVRETARNAGVGRMLKEHQRAALAHMGIPEMQWTFDPLVAKNAHFNLNRLGARVTEYVRDMYGNTGSALHGTVTDRIIVACPTNADHVEWSKSPVSGTPVPILTRVPQDGDLTLSDESQLPPSVWIEIPPDIMSVIAESPGIAAMWRLAVRHHFEWALLNGYTVTGFHRDPATSRAFYMLELGNRGK